MRAKNRDYDIAMPWKNKEDELAYQAKWRENNREKTRKSALKYYNKKKQDPKWKAKHAARYKAWCDARPGIHTKRAKQYRTKNPGRFAVYEIRKRYKVSLVEAEQLFERRKQGCEVCGSKNRTAIDHCHTSGKVRGILCGNCNQTVGHAFDNPYLLRKLANYLEAHQ